MELAFKGITKRQFQYSFVMMPKSEMEAEQVEAIVKKHKPDAIGLQETKVHDDDFPYEIPESLGYKAHIHGQKGHYGVAILTKEEPLNINKGFETDNDESQKRFISVTLKKGRKKIHILNGYFPQGEEREHPVKFPYKVKFYKDLITHLQKNYDSKDHLIVMGDLNISPQDIDCLLYTSDAADEG